MASPSERDRRAQDLRAVLHGTDEQVPDAVLRAAKAAYTWRTVDEELAFLQHDSLVGAAEQAVRGAATAVPELLVFEASGVTVLVQVAGRLLTGQLLPAAAASIELVGPQGVIGGVRAGESGFFTVDGVPGSAVRLRLTLPGGAAVLTPWFRSAGSS